LRTAPLNPAGNILGYSTDGWEPLSEDWDDWQPRLAVMFELYPQQSVYLNVSRGYKAGGFEPAATPDLSVFKPETVSSVDLGIRGTIWQGQLYYNMAAFYYDYRDYQVQVIANGLARTINSEGVTGSGVEWELNSHLGRFWQLRLQGDYTDAHFDELYTDAGSAKGNSTILTPRYSVGLLLDYKRPIASWGSLGLGWQSDYQSDIFYTVHNTPDARRGDVQLHHLRLSYFAPSGRWQVDFIARNLFDKDYTIFQQDVGAGPVARRGLPRQVMAEFSARL
jgi:iron complex outermembrane receptor protein